jgi:hypothetical protein
LIETALLGFPSRGFKPDRIAIPASFFRFLGYVSQKFFKKIFIAIDHFQTRSLRVLLQSLQSLLIFLIRMDVGIEKVSNHFIPSFFDPFKGINTAVGAADMEEGFHSTGGSFCPL